jgi:hypothetical protein
LTTGSTVKNAIVEKYNQASQLKNTLKNVRTPLSGKSTKPAAGKPAASGAGGLSGLMGSGMGMGMPGMGNIMNGVGSLDSNTTNTLMTSAIGAASEVAKDPKLRKAAIGVVKNGTLDTSLVAESVAKNPGAIDRIMKHGKTAAGAVANDEGAIQYAAAQTGASVENVRNTGKAALAGADMAAEAALNNPELKGQLNQAITNRVIDDAIKSGKN